MHPVAEVVRTAISQKQATKSAADYITLALESIKRAPLRFQTPGDTVASMRLSQATATCG